MSLFRGEKRGTGRRQHGHHEISEETAGEFESGCAFRVGYQGSVRTERVFLSDFVAQNSDFKFRRKKDHHRARVCRAKKVGNFFAREVVVTMLF